jgi:F0F1-type ATP synthase assembly protein I
MNEDSLKVRTLSSNTSGDDVMKEPRSDDNQWRGFFLTSAVGADLVCCLIVGYFGGHFLGSKFGHSFAWMIGGVLVGLAVGIVSVILLLKSFSEGSNE